ncbi:FkbM family methyltransferase [uncultured Roseibium sp.]|uniref:FkbM family methyltransferase n=1 Tax=uncultured Roseibium sp. TaxID=1936171 RepID=UPI0026380CE9|nr:FkbM family methyltransferase [uncultured Roseibium sp.]
MNEISGKGALFGVSGDSPYYIEPERLGPDPVIYCAGLGHQIEFEMALARTVEVVLNCFDPTDESACYLRQKKPDGLRFAQVGLFDRDGTVSFAVKKERAKYYNSVEVKQEHSAGIDEDTFQVRRVGTIMRALGHDRIDLLKIDIEGAEYAVLDDMLEAGILPGQLALEWHYSYVGGGDRDRGLEITQDYIRKLKGLGYRLAYSARNDTEMTLVRDTV